MKRLTKYFFEGLLFLTPIVATVYVLFLIFSKIDHIFRFSIPGLGFLVTIAIVTAIGFLVSTFFAKGVVILIDKLFSRMPLTKLIYTSIKDLINAFVGEKKRFSKPVLVTLSPASSLQIIGFVTCESLETLALPGSVAVYIPQSYNFAGNLIVVPREQVTPIAADSGSVMAFIVSGGVTAP
ncbi:MAG: DUF502 domain-containing protein [Nitrospirota bacterium]